LQHENPDNGWSWNVHTTGRSAHRFLGVDPKFRDTRQDILKNHARDRFEVGKTFENFNIKLTIGDILQSLVYYQDANQDGKYSNVSGSNADRLMYNYTHGYTTTLTFNYTF
jgi:hypothetical protein